MTEAVMTLAGRRRFHGTRQILAFNWPRYAAALGVLTVCAALLSWVEEPLARAVLMGGAAATLWWTMASIAASWWIYDASGLTEWTWLRPLAGAPSRWVSIHAGFDDTSEALARLFPSREYRVLDIYDPTVTT